MWADFSFVLLLCSLAHSVYFHHKKRTELFTLHLPQYSVCEKVKAFKKIHAIQTICSYVDLLMAENVQHLFLVSWQRSAFKNCFSRVNNYTFSISPTLILLSKEQKHFIQVALIISNVIWINYKLQMNGNSNLSTFCFKCLKKIIQTIKKSQIIKYRDINSVLLWQEQIKNHISLKMLRFLMTLKCQHIWMIVFFSIKTLFQTCRFFVNC